MALKSKSEVARAKAQSLDSKLDDLAGFPVGRAGDTLVAWLLRHGFLGRDRSGNLVKRSGAAPLRKKADAVFEVHAAIDDFRSIFGPERIADGGWFDALHAVTSPLETFVAAARVRVGESQARERWMTEARLRSGRAETADLARMCDLAADLLAAAKAAVSNTPTYGGRTSF